MTVLGETVKFQVFDAMKHYLNSLNCFHVEILDAMVEEEFTRDKLEDLLALERELEEMQCVGSIWTKDDPETGLGFEEKKKVQA
ncbi:hypothetical protein ACOSQ3_021150 [Xanthoceras sorbifolium]